MNSPATGSPGGPTQDPIEESAETPTLISTEAQKSRAAELYELVARQKFFSGLTMPQLQLLANAAMEIEFEAGHWICRQGDPANRFYIILQGKVVIESETKERGSMAIRTVGPNEDLGWTWLFPPYYMHFSARAIEPVQAIFFYGTRIRQQCEEDHALGYELMKRIAQVVIQDLDAIQQRMIDDVGGRN